LLVALDRLNNIYYYINRKGVKMKMMMFKALVFLWFSVMAADLLYLYYAGGWQEPIAIVRIAELILLYGFVPLGIVLAVKEIRSLFVRSKKQ
jgi:hypothetical protein